MLSGSSCSSHIEEPGQLLATTLSKSAELPAMASTQKYGSIQILAAHTEPGLAKFYQYVMSTNKEEIRCRDIWHIVVSFQHYVQTALSSESLAEAFGVECPVESAWSERLWW